MPIYIALLRAVNVGGTGKLPMSDLKAMCKKLGFSNCRTYIASGNILFKSELNSAKVQGMLQQSLLRYAGKPVGVHIRTPTELKSIIASNPFSNAAGNRNMVIFLDTAPPIDSIAKATGQIDEKIALGVREIYIHHGEGMGQSKLKIPAAKLGTTRNMNTVTKLFEMASG